MELKELFIIGELDKVARKLIKMNNKKYDDVLDKHFILKNLALTYKKLNKFEISRYYLGLGLENIKSEKLLLHVEYYELQWLNIELNKDLLNDKEKLEIYEDMYKYYKEINYKRNECCLLCNIYRLNKEYDNMRRLLCEVCNSDFEEIDDAIKEILQDFKLLGDTYYTEAIKIVKKNYRNNFMVL